MILHKTHGFYTKHMGFTQDLWNLLQTHGFSSEPMDFTPNQWILHQIHEINKDPWIYSDLTFFFTPLDSMEFTNPWILLQTHWFYTKHMIITPDL